MNSIPVIAAAMSLAACAHAPSPREAAESLAAAETAFAAHSLRTDMRAAFLAHFADDGLFVRGGWTAARAWIEPRPAPPIVLDWRPAYVEVAASGDFGLSTGPFKLTSSIRGDAPPAYGQFVSIWTRAADGPWKVAVDLGFSHPAPTYWDAPLDARSVPPGERGGTLAADEAAFAHSSAADGERSAYRAHGSENLRHYRDGVTPQASLTGALASRAMSDARVVWTATRVEVASSGDLGYALGTYADAASPASVLGDYLRVWRREGGTWKLALDVVNPRPGG